MRNKLKIVLILILPFFFFACGKNKNIPLTIYSIRGSSGLGLVKLFEEPPEIKGFNVKMEAVAQQDLMAASFISGEAKAGILPPNMAAKIFSSGVDIKAAAVIGAGMLSLLSADPDIRHIQDLKGKSIEVAGQGATPDYVFRKILRNHNINPNTQVTLGYSLAPPEIAQSLIENRISVALLPEPFATMAVLGNPNLRLISDIQEEWRWAGGGASYPMTLLVVNCAFASENPDAVYIILEAVKSSIEWVKANPGEAGILVEKHELGMKASVVTAAVPKSNYVFIPAEEARNSLEALFKVFLENDPVSIGGELPGDDFYLK